MSCKAQENLYFALLLYLFVWNAGFPYLTSPVLPLMFDLRSENNPHWEYVGESGICWLVGIVVGHNTVFFAISDSSLPLL
jgi:hypothetical protein